MELYLIDTPGYYSLPLYQKDGDLLNLLPKMNGLYAVELIESILNIFDCTMEVLTAEEILGRDLFDEELTNHLSEEDFIDTLSSAMKVYTNAN